MTREEFIEWFTEPDHRNSYLKRAVEFANGYEPDMWSHLERVPLRQPEESQAILAHLLELACQCQNMSNIQTGRYGIITLPKAWAISHVEAAAEPVLAAGGGWEYRRLLELYLRLDEALFRRLVARTANSDDREVREVREAGEDMLAQLSEWKRLSSD